MEYVYTIDSDGELHHWGIKGMKWGRRRYQNKDGSLTPEGRKRYGDDDGDSPRAKPKKKKLSEMSDEEINRAIARKQLEDRYRQYHPEPIKKESFVKTFVNDAVKPAAVNSGKKAIEAFLNKAVNKALEDKVDPNSYEGLKKVYDKLKVEKDILMTKADIAKAKKGKTAEEEAAEALQRQHDEAKRRWEIADWENKRRKAESGEWDLSAEDQVKLAKEARDRADHERKEAIRKYRYDHYDENPTGNDTYWEREYELSLRGQSTAQKRQAQREYEAARNDYMNSIDIERNAQSETVYRQGPADTGRDYMSDGAGLPAVYNRPVTDIATTTVARGERAVRHNPVLSDNQILYWDADGNIHVMDRRDL